MPGVCCRLHLAVFCALYCLRLCNHIILALNTCTTCYVVHVGLSVVHMRNVFVLSSILLGPLDCKCAAVHLKKVEKKTHQEDITGAITMTASDQLQMTDYVLKYYEDSDVEDT